jgi:plastocyanin
MRSSRVAAVAAGLFIVLPVAGAAAATRSVTIAGFAFSPAVTTAVQNDAVTWRNADGAPHTTTSTFPGPVGWSSGTLGTGATFSKVLTAAGTYTYRCLLHGGMTGTAQVPVKVAPATGTTTTTFTIRVASATAPAGFDYVIERKAPGATGFLAWRTTTAASVAFTPDRGTGTYSFRSLVRKTSSGQRTAASPARSITVS